MTRLRTTSGSPYEAQFGFCRAVRVGDRIVVAGTGPIDDDGSTTPGDAAQQAERCCALIVRAIEQLGGSAAHVVRTRIFLTDITAQDAVGAVHARWFDPSPPPSGQRWVTVLTLVQNLRPSVPYWLVSPNALRFHPPKL